MRYTREEALEAVKTRGKGLWEIDEIYCDDEEIVKVAVSADGYYNFHYASERLKNNLDMVMYVTDYGPVTLYEISNKEILSNRNLMLKLVTGRFSNHYSTSVLCYIDKKLLWDYEILYNISLLRKYKKMICDTDSDSDNDGYFRRLTIHGPNLHKITNLTKWLKSQVNIQKGNGLQLYHNDYDISIVFF